MSRENQGLQVAVMVFFMLAVVLGVTTLVFFKQYTAATGEAATCLEEAGTLRAAVAVQREEISELKRLMGLAATAKWDTVRAEFAEDMQSYAAGFPEEARFYRPVLACQHHVIRDKNIELADLKREIQDWKDRYERLEGIKSVQVEQYQTAAARARSEVADVQKAAEQRRYRMTRDNTEMHQKVVQTRQEAELAQADAETKLTKLQRDYQRVLREAKALRKKLAELRGHDFTIPDGTVRGVSYRLGLAWIDLGRADSLERVVNFDVYPAHASRLNVSTQKGKIEVSKILGEHLAEARVMDEEITDPILRGDKVHTPLWSRRPQ